MHTLGAQRRVLRVLSFPSRLHLLDTMAGKIVAMEVQSTPSMRDDVEGGRGSQSGSSVASAAQMGSSCFPLRVFKCLPMSVQSFIPGTWKTVQDWTHLVLIAGVVASLLLVTHTFYDMIFAKMGEKCRSNFCVKEVLAIVFMLPCTIYFIRIIGQYDDRLQKKQRDAKEQKEQLTKAYHDLLSDMDGLLTKSAESSAGLAERSFESKRRDFQRFLERAKTKYSQMFNGTKAENEELLTNFRKFVMNWLRVFEECSIDPIKCPKRVVMEEELNRCQTIAEVAELTLDRLRVTEVRFISIQRDQDAQMLRKNRTEFRRLTTAPDPRMWPALAHQDSSTSSNRSLTTELAPGAGVKNQRRMSWLSVDRRGFGLSLHSSSAQGGFPKELRLCCWRLVVLSKEHGNLLMGFIVGWLILLLEIVHTTTFFMGAMIEVVVQQVCLVVLLVRFEEIDVIQQLEREVKELKKAEENVQKQREKMTEFWSNAQQLTELWLHRTVPRLDLYKEVHSLLEDAKKEDVVDWMGTANARLEGIDNKLGALDNWRNNGSLGLDAKKAFGKQINQILQGQEQEFVGIMNKLENVNKEGLKCLEAPPPNFKKSPSVRT